MKIRIFCSYAHSDVEVVKQLIADLEQAGYEVWRDADELRPGDSWWNEILDAIEACHIFLLAVSQGSLSSIYCQAEWEYALSLNKPLLPVKVNRDADKVVLPDALKIVQVGEIIDAKTLADKTPVIKVLGAITALLQRPYISPDAPPGRPPLPKTLIDELSKQVQALKSLTPDEQAQVVHHLQQLREYDPNAQVRRRAEEELTKLSASPYATQQARQQAEVPVLTVAVPPPAAPPSNPAAVPRWLVASMGLLALAVLAIGVLVVLDLPGIQATVTPPTQTPPLPTATLLSPSPTPRVYPSDRSALLPDAPRVFRDEFDASTLDFSRWYIPDMTQGTAVLDFNMLLLDGTTSLVSSAPLREGDAFLITFNLSAAAGSRHFFIETGDLSVEDDPTRRLIGFVITPENAGMVSYCVGAECTFDAARIEIRPGSWYYLLLWIRPEGRFQVSVWPRYWGGGENTYLLNRELIPPGSDWADHPYTLSVAASDGAGIRLASAERLLLPPEYVLPVQPPR